MTVADFLQLTPVRGKCVSSRFFNKYKMKHLLRWQLLHSFKNAELTDVVKELLLVY